MQSIVLLHLRGGRFPCSLGVVERLRLRRLRWGDAADAAALAERFGQFDIVLGADVVYVEQCVPQLFSTVSQLLAPSPQVTALSQGQPRARQGPWMCFARVWL